MPSGEPRTTSRCAECATPLATDQAYCVHCGARRGPLPARVAVALADIENHGRPIASDDPLLDDPQPEVEPENIVSAARTGMIAVLVMLAFGVVIGGAFSSGGLGALANTIVVAVRPTVQQAAQVVTNAGGDGGGGGGGQSNNAGGGGGDDGGGVVAATVGTTSAPAPVTVTVSQTASTSPGTGTTPAQAQLPPIDHVWLIVLGQQGYQQAWATGAGHPYLNTLRKQGELVVNYDAVASSPLANEVALISGQGPTQQTAADCPTYTYIDPGTSGKQQQVLGDGCIYPQTTETLPQQFLANGLSWKAYVQGIGQGSAGCAQSGSSTSSSFSSTSSTTSSVPTPTPTPTPSPTVPTPTPTPGPTPSPTVPTSTVGTTTTSSSTTTGACPTTSSGSSTTTASSTTTSASSTPTPTTPASNSSTTSTPSTTDPVDTIGAATCPHPALNALSLNQSVTSGSTYVNWKNPVIYFQGLLLPSGECQTNDVGIAQLAKDLKNPTPTFSYISPDPCDDGSDTPCRPGAKTGLAQADVFLQRVVPEIERSASYKQNGLILITFASAPQSGPHWDTSSCCGQPTYPNLPSPSTTSASSTTSTSSSSTGTTPSATPPAVTATETVTTTTTTASPSVSTTDTGTTTGASPDCVASGSDTSTSSSTTSSPSAATTPAAPTTSSSTTTSTTTTPGECAPVIVGTPPGGGQVGLLMISPWIAPGKSDVVDTLNHFSVLKGVEQLFKLPNLGYAKVTSLQGFGTGMFAASRR
jgi:hypothetical protein